MDCSLKARQVRESSTLSLSARTKELAATGRDVLNFTVGEPDFDTPNYIKKAAVDALFDGFTKYTPAAGTPELRKAICDKLKRDNGLDYAPSQIVVSNGAKHALANVFTAILNEGDEVLLPAPYWLSYVEMVRLAGGTPVIVRAGAEQSYKVTRRQLEDAATNRTKALLINTPNNPSGMVYSEAELRELADFAAARDLYIISDEIYEKLIYDGTRHVSPASLSSDACARTVVINGFSKTYAMTGWRVGYSACRAELAGVIGNIQSHLASNTNSIAQRAAEVALVDGDAAISAMAQTFKARRDRIFERLSAVPGISLLKPQGAFYAFVDVSKLCGVTFGGQMIHDGADFARALLDETGVAVVPCADFGFPNHIRMTYAVSMADIDEGVKLLGDFVRHNFI